MHATETNRADEVLDVVLRADHEPAKVMEPSEKSVDSPTSSVPKRDGLPIRDRFHAPHLGVPDPSLCLAAFGESEPALSAVEVVGLLVLGIVESACARPRRDHPPASRPWYFDSGSATQASSHLYGFAIRCRVTYEKSLKPFVKPAETCYLIFHELRMRKTVIRARLSSFVAA